jgi:hypothetical protein
MGIKSQIRFADEFAVRAGLATAGPLCCVERNGFLIRIECKSHAPDTIRRIKA